uniref:Uncharacterized protein n=1 Tax=Nothobranchius furzeri TaxID=105023 RepID=A0A8C6QA41_NOTFU
MPNKSVAEQRLKSLKRRFDKEPRFQEEYTRFLTEVNENGISEAIKVKVKCDKGGVGHKEGEQFSFHWWDHVFNKASASLQVESDQNGTKVKKTADEEDGTISNKKPRKALLERAKLYGSFVKSATLNVTLKK